MLSAIASLTLLGLILGLSLGFAARYFRVESDSLTTEVETLLPGANCGQCGYPGCGPAAQAVAAGEAPVTLCPPGGPALVEALAAKLNVTMDPSTATKEPRVAWVDESLCIGCARCGKTCPTDAIVGASKQVHGVIQEACMGCGRCLDACPTQGLRLAALPVTLQTWYWPKPVELRA